MTELTITLEDGVADWALAEADRRNTTFSQLVGELLAEKMRHHDRYEQAMKEALKFESWGVSDTPF